MANSTSQFYKDNSPNYEEFKVVDTMLEGLSKAFDDIISQAIDNSNISTMRAFTTIPIQIINVMDACYTLSTLLSNKEVLNITGINQNLNMQEKIDTWDNLPPKTRAQALEQTGYVLTLVNPNILKDDDVYGDTFKVISFDIYDYNSGDKLIYGLDYYYEYNKIYFLRFGAQTSKYSNRNIILKNIVIDNNSPEKILGESLNIYANSNFSPSEYRDVITSFASAALAGPVINRINQSFNPDTGLSSLDRTYGLNDDENSLKGIRVIDYKSADSIRKRFWEGNEEGRSNLNIFDFLVVMPSDYLNKSEKVEYIQKFMQMIKPAQTSFILSPEYEVKDSLPMRYSAHSFNISGAMSNIKDSMTSKNIITHSLSMLAIDRTGLKRHSNHVSDLPQADTDYHVDSILLTDDFLLRLEHQFLDSAKKMVSVVSSLAEINMQIDKIMSKDIVSQEIFAAIKDRSLIKRDTEIDANLPETDTDYHVDSVFMEDKFSVISKSDVSDNIKEVSSEVSNFAEVNIPKDNIKKSDEYKGNVLSEVKDFIDCDDGDIDNNLDLNYKDSINATSEVLSTLNESGICDKITSIKDEETRKVISSKEDSLKFSSRANQVKCDSIFNFDFEQENLLVLDLEGTSTDTDTVGQELVSIKLIPKS